MSHQKGIKRPFSYFGSKHAIADRYPAPKYTTIIEPFAGSAGYACLWGEHPRRVKLYDVDYHVVQAWEALVERQPSEVINLPQAIDDVPCWAKSLVGFWLANGRATPATKPSSWMLSGERPNAYWGAEARFKLTIISGQVKHWEIGRCSWKDVPLIEATWFIDPPYQSNGGRSYTHDHVDYVKLGEWCKSLPGQVIVCEERGADWLPFEPLGEFKCSPGRGKATTKEVIWTR